LKTRKKGRIHVVFVQGKAMIRYVLLVTFLFLSPNAIAQQTQLPQGLTKAEFFGDMNRPEFIGDRFI
jgi:hypothetical protein